MRIIIDNQIPFLGGVFPSSFEVSCLPFDEITRESVREADALFIRTRTRCDGELLEGSKVRFIATATIGYDHIDRQYCEANGIVWVSCPGCNSQAVCDYVEEAIRYCKPMLGSCSSIGVVGVGHVGQKVSAMARRMGLEVVENDPPRGIWGDVSGCDIITYHTPLTYDDGRERYYSYHLCDSTFLSRLRSDALIINAARGGVVDEEALLSSGRKCVIDCWEGEPCVREELVKSENTLLASFHIAGYSLEGKRNASQMCLDAFCRQYDMKPIQLPLIGETGIERGDSERGWIARVSERLKSSPLDFERFRKEYVLR